MRLYISFLRDLYDAADPIIHPVAGFVKRTKYKQMPGTQWVPGIGCHHTKLPALPLSAVLSEGRKL